jgi:hypothetical protein
MYTELNRRNQIDICASPCQGLTGTVQDNRPSSLEAGIMQDFKKIDRAKPPSSQRKIFTYFFPKPWRLCGRHNLFRSSLHPNILG